MCVCLCVCVRENCDYLNNNDVVALNCFSSICSPFTGLCVLGEVIGVLLMVALPLKPKPDPVCRSESFYDCG